MPLNHTICACCGGEASLPVARHGQWTFLACASCRGMELSPVPSETELKDYYNGEYSVPCSETYYRHYEGISRDLLDVIDANAGVRGTMLEVGCSHGAFLL